VGLGGRIRCMLCLSSIRSSGLEIPGALLVEFLLDKVIAPKEALHLALRKGDQEVGAVMTAIAQFLPPGSPIRWRFTTKNARIKLRRLYPSIQT
jgi:hypothetical protein